MADLSVEDGDARRASVLFVCTANRIRSPFAAAAAREIATDRGIRLQISSAGFNEGGLPAMDRMVEVAAKSGIDLSDHVSQQMTEDLIAGSDLVITMTGTHVVDLTGTHAEARQRTVTLREAASATQTTGAPQWNPVALREWVAQVADRPLEVLLGGRIDIADPVGRSKGVHRRTADVIRELLEQLLVSQAEPPGPT